MAWPNIKNMDPIRTCKIYFLRVCT